MSIMIHIISIVSSAINNFSKLQKAERTIRSFNFFISIVVLIQLIFYLSSVLLLCLQNQVNGDETKQFCFKSKAFIDRNIFSCYQLIPSINDVFVAEAFKMKPNTGKSSV